MVKFLLGVQVGPPRFRTKRSELRRSEAQQLKPGCKGQVSQTHRYIQTYTVNPDRKTPPRIDDTRRRLVKLKIGAERKVFEACGATWVGTAFLA